MKILIMSGAAGHPVMGTIDQLLAVALRNTGNDVIVYHCDEKLYACLRLKYESGMLPSDLESGNWKSKESTCLGCRAHRQWSQSLAGKNDSNAEISHQFPVNSVGSPTESAVAGAIRYFAKSNLANEPRSVLEDFQKADLQAEQAARNLYSELKPDLVILHHGIYVPQGSYLKAAKDLRIPIVTWTTGYRRGTLLFSREDTYHKTMIKNDSDIWAKLEMNQRRLEILDNYLISRESGTSDWVTFQKVKTIKSRMNSFAELKSIGSKFVLIITNVSWDARIHFENTVFEDMFAWIRFVVDETLISTNKRVVIRAHPAETRGVMPSRDSVEEFIRKNYQNDSRIQVVDSESSLTSYDLARKADQVHVYGSKMAIELSAQGIPCIVSGDAWTSRKGITYDIQSLGELKGYISGSKILMEEARIRRAKQYAYYFFFMKLIRVEELCEVDLKRNSLRKIVEKASRDQVISTSLTRLAQVITSSDEIILEDEII